MTLRLRIATETDLDAVADVATATFNPETDAISAHLFPPHLKPPGEAYAHAARPWRLARKADRFHSQRTVLIVAVDEALSGKVVGFALWEKPARGDQGGEPEAAPVKPPCATLDHAAFDEMKKVLGRDHAMRFGERGADTVWREFQSSQPPVWGDRTDHMQTSRCLVLIPATNEEALVKCSCNGFLRKQTSLGKIAI